MNGIYTTENPWLLKEVLRNQWGFKGLVMSDWGSAHNGVPAANSGLDLEMAGGEKTNPKDMLQYLKTGQVTMATVDDKVRHILRVLIAYGFKDGIEEDKSIALDDPASAETALNVAREGIVLLKNNNNFLPINTKKIRNIIVTGKNACRNVHGGGSGNVNPFHFVSMFEGIRKEALLNHTNVEYVDEFDFMPKIIFTDQKHDKQGFQAEYFNNATLEGTSVFKQIEKKINYSWVGGTEIKDVSKDKFSVRWTGILRSNETSDYDFTLGGDDGYRMYINDELVIDDWTPGGYRSTDFTKTLQKEINYRIRIEYYQQGGGAAVNFIWKKKNDTTDYYANYLNKADLIIACFGHNSDTEGEGSDRSFGLPELDKRMFSSILKVKKTVIGVVSAGGNIEMQEWEPKLNGLLWSWYAGQEGGTALADVLFGKVNPSGKLPMTFEKKWEDNPAYSNYYDPDGDKHVKYNEGIFIGYRGYDKLKRKVQYPFGFGLSYTGFKVSDLIVSNPDGNGDITITTLLSNIGKRAGAQVVQIYVGKTEKGIVEHPEKELKSFKKIFLEPGQSRSVKITLPKEAFTYFDIETKGFVKDPGKYNIMLGFSFRDIKLNQIVDVH
ncbi:glycoside hydrolase family 3 C-terminal domain-containing protein [Arcticibacter eurypsychrophilus]|uniref:glycoside hydrolase family 3 C-terminal domain-containing protein n=1 Tax=Arcticibacter eurypsychrophilus TaxID=1434752 RepID=UPI000A8960A1|nr:glycoside hydrolase family 3 C-terminal domain-containing protein [Arcticibacter eurypsychrophilus]